jgi:hypothetical protein
MEPEDALGRRLARYSTAGIRSFDKPFQAVKRREANQGQQVDPCLGGLVAEAEILGEDFLMRAQLRQDVQENVCDRDAAAE